MSNYDEESFWAGVALGQQLKGWAAFGIMDGFDPDGGLVVRPIQQGIQKIIFDKDQPFTVLNVTDTIATDGEDTMQVPTPGGINENVNAIVFQRDREFGIMPLSEDIDLGALVYFFEVNQYSDRLIYNSNLVSAGASGLYLKSSYYIYSEEEEIDSGNMEVLRVNNSHFETIESQRVY